MCFRYALFQSSTDLPTPRIVPVRVQVHYYNSYERILLMHILLILMLHILVRIKVTDLLTLPPSLQLWFPSPVASASLACSSLSLPLITPCVTFVPLCYDTLLWFVQFFAPAEHYLVLCTLMYLYRYALVPCGTSVL